MQWKSFGINDCQWNSKENQNKTRRKSTIGNLINIILGKMIIPELIQYDCNSVSISKALEKLINDIDYKELIKKDVKEAVGQLSTNSYSSLIASEVLMKLINKWNLRFIKIYKLKQFGI